MQCHCFQEPLFDTSDLRSIKSDDIIVTDSKITAPRGPIELEMSLLYDAPMRKMTIHVMQARCLPPLANGQQTHTQVFLHTFRSGRSLFEFLNFFKGTHVTVAQ